MKYAILVIIALALPAFLIGCHGDKIATKVEKGSASNQKVDKPKGKKYDPRLDGPYWMGVDQ